MERVNLGCVTYFKVRHACHAPARTTLRALSRNRRSNVVSGASDQAALGVSVCELLWWFQLPSRL
jgi:hypothetical protein